MKAKKDDVEIVQKAMTAFDIAQEVQAVVQKIIDQEGEIKDGDIECLEAWSVQLEIKADNIARVDQRLEYEAALYKAIEEQAKARRKAREGAKDNLRKYLVSCMKTAGVKSIKNKGSLASITLCDGRESIVVDDVKQLPLDCVEERMVYDAKKDVIKQKISSGETVPGAHVEVSAPYLMIR